MILSVTPTNGIVTTILRDPRCDISAQVMKQMLRAERMQIPQKRKFLQTTSAANIQRGIRIITDCLWLPARQLVCYAANMVDEQSAGDGPFSDKSTFFPSNEFLLEIRVTNGKWTMRDRDFGFLPTPSTLIVPLRE